MSYIIIPNAGSGVEGTGWAGEVNYYNELPPANSKPGEVWLVRNDSGSWPLKRLKGFYRSDGISWIYLAPARFFELLDVANENYQSGEAPVYDETNRAFFPAKVALDPHTHQIEDIEGLQDLLDQKAGGPIGTLCEEIYNVRVVMTTEDIQDLIDNLNHYIPPNCFRIIRFEPGAYELTDTLRVIGFYGGGTLVIQGNPEDAYLSEEYSVRLDGSGIPSSSYSSGPVFYLKDNRTRIKFDKLDVVAPDSGVYSGAITSGYNRLIHITGLNVIGTGTANSWLFRFNYMDNVLYYYGYVSAGRIALLSSVGSRVYLSRVNTGDQPAGLIGIYSYGAIVFKDDSSLQGGLYDDYTDAGGQIWP